MVNLRLHQVWNLHPAHTHTHVCVLTIQESFAASICSSRDTEGQRSEVKHR